MSKDVFLSDVGHSEVDFSWAVVLPTFLANRLHKSKDLKSNINMVTSRHILKKKRSHLLRLTCVAQERFLL